MTTPQTCGLAYKLLIIARVSLRHCNVQSFQIQEKQMNPLRSQTLDAGVLAPREHRMASDRVADSRSRMLFRRTLFPVGSRVVASVEEFRVVGHLAQRG